MAHAIIKHSSGAGRALIQKPRNAWTASVMIWRRWINFWLLSFFRMAAKGWVPPEWFEPNVPPPEERGAVTGTLKIEIVSHCWAYDRFLIYQLSSLVHFPPKDCRVTMTVFYSTEDKGTSQLLDYFDQIEVPNVTWRWMAIPKERLFRRAIGRNRAALSTEADWVWFTDCDLMFRHDCLDTLAAKLQGRRDALVYPQTERRTDLLWENHPLLSEGDTGPHLVDIEDDDFAPRHLSRATGPVQIAHGDVCRAVGYCNSIGLYQKPSDVWCKAYEDRAFRWLLKTQGTPLDIPGVYRIRHIHKGRYAGSKTHTRLRTRLRLIQDSLRKLQRSKS